MTEEIISCDFYNEKICTLFSKYFGFNVECKNLSLCTVDSDDEKECPIKRLEQENKELKKQIEPQTNYTVKKFYTDKEYNELKQENKELLETLTKGCYQNLQHECRIWELKESKYRFALEEILESAKFAQCLPCGSGNLEDCLNCNDDTTNNGQFCMEKRIHDIKTKCVEVLGTEA